MGWNMKPVENTYIATLVKKGFPLAVAQDCFSRIQESILEKGRYYLLYAKPAFMHRACLNQAKKVYNYNRVRLKGANQYKVESLYYSQQEPQPFHGLIGRELGKRYQELLSITRESLACVSDTGLSIVTLWLQGKKLNVIAAELEMKDAACRQAFFRVRQKLKTVILAKYSINEIFELLRAFGPISETSITKLLAVIFQKNNRILDQQVNPNTELNRILDQQVNPNIGLIIKTRSTKQNNCLKNRNLAMILTAC